MAGIFLLESRLSGDIPNRICHRDELFPPPDEHVTIKPDASYNNVGNVSFMSCGRIGISPSDGWTVGQYIVMNDYLELDGKVIMNADPVEKKTPTPGRIPESTQIDRDILYQPDQLIKPEKSNGTFNMWGSATRRRKSQDSNQKISGPQLMMSTRMGRLPSHPVCPHISEWTVHRTG